MLRNQFGGDLVAGGLFAFQQQPPCHAGQRGGGGVGFRMVMRDVRLLNAALDENFFACQRDQHGGQIAHGRAVAAIFLGRRSAQAAGGNVMADATPAGVADVNGLAAHPGDKSVGDGAQIPAVAGDQGGAECERHFRIIGHAPGLQTQPAAADDFPVDFILRGDFARGHEFDGGAQSIADGQTEKRPKARSNNHGFVCGRGGWP